MGSNSSRQAPGVHLRVLTDEQCEQLVMAAYEVLERTGARFYDARALGILKGAGCCVDGEAAVRFPAGVIQESLATAPQRFGLWTRDGDLAIRVEPGRAHFGPGPTCPNFIDPDTGERRGYVKNDAALTARACDALDNIDYVMSLGSVTDCPPREADIHEFDAMLRETTKPIMSWSFSRESLERIRRMCAEIIGMARRIARGIRVDDERLATDAIAQATVEGTYLALPHTVDNFREEMWFPRLLDRSRYEQWRAGGGSRMAERVRRRVQEILAGHRAPPLAKEIREYIDRIVSEPRRE